MSYRRDYYNGGGGYGRDYYGGYDQDYYGGYDRGYGGGYGGYGSRGGGRSPRGGWRGGRGGFRGRGGGGRGYNNYNNKYDSYSGYNNNNYYNNDKKEEGPKPKKTPRFSKVEKLRPNQAGFAIVKIAKVETDSSYDLPVKRGKVRTIPCTQATVGDDTGSITLITRQQDIATTLQENTDKYVCLLNVSMSNEAGKARLEASQFSTVKSVDDCKDILPEGSDVTFELNTSPAHHKTPKPQWCTIAELTPEQKGVNIVLKIGPVKVNDRLRLDGSSTTVAEAYVGDTELGIDVIARHEHVQDMVEGRVVAIFNAHVSMFENAFMRLIIDRWSSVKAVSSVDSNLLPNKIPSDETVLANNKDKTKNRSLVEWIAVDDEPAANANA